MTRPHGSLILISASFFGWGVLRALQDVLVIAGQVRHPDHDATAMLVHFSFFVGYLLVPLPASRLIARYGLRFGLVGACGIIGFASLLSGVDGWHSSDLPRLGYIFAIATGIAMLQTAGNGGVTLMGPPQTGARRLLGAQGVMALGSALAPILVTMSHSTMSPDPAVMLFRARILYLVVGTLMVVLAAAIVFRRDNRLSAEHAAPAQTATHLRMDKPMAYALVAVFLFVGTEATVISHILRYQMNFSGTALVPVLPWLNVLSVYWLVVMGGRLLSYQMLRRFNLVALLQGIAWAATVLVAVALFGSGQVGLFALLATGLVNAAIFPLIFCSVTECLDRQQVATASGWLMTAMCGGAIIPLMSGEAADHLGFKSAFIIPILSYVWIACTATRCHHGELVKVPSQTVAISE